MILDMFEILTQEHERRGSLKMRGKCAVSCLLRFQEQRRTGGSKRSVTGFESSQFCVSCHVMASGGGHVVQRFMN